MLNCKIVLLDYFTFNIILILDSLGLAYSVTVSEGDFDGVGGQYCLLGECAILLH